MVGDVLLTEYMEQDDFLFAVERAHRAEPFAAVVPGLEYAVPAAAAAAERLGLPGAGLDAARTLRDKLRLRQVTSAAGIPNPRWAEIDSPNDIHRFAGDGPVVVKPTGRQASLGVHLLDRADDAGHVTRVWEAVRTARETVQVPDREIPTRFLAEERLAGREYSVEALVTAGEIRFLNVTEKAVLPGEHPVELGHLVPAPLPSAIAARFTERMRALVDAVGFGYGILHAEWILASNAGPILIECAGRIPGDHILELIGLAYDFDPFAAVVDILHGQTIDLPARAVRAAGIRFVTAPPGVVRATGDPNAARALPGTVDTALTVQPGQVVGPCRSSWDRLGHAIAVGATPIEALARADAALDMLAVETQPSQRDATDY